MTPRHAVTPDEHKQAVFAATHLSHLLVTRHNIPATAHDLPSGVVVSVFYGLVAHVAHVTHVDAVIWWAVPDMTGTRRRPLTTYAHTTEIAADRLAEHYHQLRSVPLADMLASRRITYIAAALLEETEVRRAAAPI
ncbi:hypothetical protein [Nonomuraea sediminis]|uniref:hypothetical protein n=1 Tax=Nonomuraea sediminis TaxID=2835864 RepID=UPI001BDCAE5E|nr:hypothetical protein [Nonomuraea sediminis]